MLAGHLSLVAAALFTGAAFYINVAEQPARLRLENDALLRQWVPAYRAGTRMQAPLAVLGCLLGMSAWWVNGSAWWIAGAGAMIANLPWTLIVMWPTNGRIEAAYPDGASEGTRRDIRRWGRLHAVRTGLGAIAVVCFLVALAG